jgi:hypothetical protein
MALSALGAENRKSEFCALDSKLMHINALISLNFNNGHGYKQMGF